MYYFHKQLNQRPSFYRLDGDLVLHKMDDNYSITNGPTFSVDGKNLYHTDTAKQTGGQE